ncbi:MAG TPA: nucleoside recognition domain-containing protein [Ignavibacteriaceae bacterium]|nr:nucleoside recognition domain-containing protein [Ignavibacteriaceae bacterium]
MLNYIWTALLFLGLAAAISYDISDGFTNKYKNGESIKVTIFSNEEIKKDAENQFDVTVIVNKNEFNSFYDANVTEDVTIPAKISFQEGKEESAIYFTVGDDSPEIWQTIAKINGKENDITGKAILQPCDSPNTFLASMQLEEVSFIKIKEVTNAAISYAETSVKIALGLIGIMALWLGVMKIAEEAGVITYIARALKPVTKKLFPDVPHDHPAMGSMIMNISATFLGLGNAATPFGIKAMEDLNTLNPNKGIATNAMCTFLVINTASFALMPTTAIALRAASGSSNPALIIGTTMFGSFCATVVGITVVKLFEKFSSNSGSARLGGLLNFKFFLALFAFAAVTVLLSVSGVLGMLSSFLNPELLKTIIQIVSTVAIPLVIFVFVLMGFIKKVKVYETFVEGAKEGFNVAVTIIPYLVAILMAIGIFRAGGAMNWLVFVLNPITDFIGMPVEALPMALMRPLSGSGSLGIMAEIISVHGPDSFIGILVSTFYGSTETTFFVLAVYFGAVNIKNTRYALPAGLISDIAGILAALFIVKLLYG